MLSLLLRPLAANAVAPNTRVNLVAINRNTGNNFFFHNSIQSEFAVSFVSIVSSAAAGKGGLRGYLMHRCVPLLPRLRRRQLPQLTHYESPINGQRPPARTICALGTGAVAKSIVEFCCFVNGRSTVYAPCCTKFIAFVCGRSTFAVSPNFHESTSTRALAKNIADFSWFLFPFF